MPLATLTRVRLSKSQAFSALETFLFGGMFATARVPRGIEPAHVAEFLRERLKLDSAASAYERALEAIWFYECADVVPHILQALNVPLENADDLTRAAFAAQAAGDLGPADLVQRVDQMFDGTLARHPEAVEVFPLLLQTRVVLAPAGSLDMLARRIDGEVRAAEKGVNVDEASMLRYDKLAAIQRNHLPRAQALIDGKSQLAAADPIDRIRPLLKIYLGRSPLSDAYTETWAGRLLRREAMGDNADKVYEALKFVVERFDEKMLEDDAKVFMFVRAAQALLYLGSALTDEQVHLFVRAGSAGMSFLWDDP